MLEAKTLTGKFPKKSLNIALTCVYLSTHTHTHRIHVPASLKLTWRVMLQGGIFRHV